MTSVYLLYPNHYYMPLFKNAIDILKKDHEEVRGLFKKLMEADVDDRPELYDKLMAEIERHAHAEETIFYPAVLLATQNETEIDTSYEDHERVRDLMADLALEDITTDKWLAKLSILQDEIEEHVKEEETVMMPAAEKALGKDALKVLGDEIKAAKDQSSMPGELGPMPA